MPCEAEDARDLHGHKEWYDHEATVEIILLENNKIYLHHICCGLHGGDSCPKVRINRDQWQVRYSRLNRPDLRVLDIDNILIDAHLLLYYGPEYSQHNEQVGLHQQKKRSNIPNNNYVSRCNSLHQKILESNNCLQNQ